MIGLARRQEQWTSVRIDQVVAVDRHRVEVGNVEKLAASIAAVGLLHPIVIAPNGRLVAGFRRLAACRSLGWTHIPSTTVSNLNDAHALLMAERDENECRLDMTPSEKVSLGKALEALERPRAEARVRAAQNNRSSANFSEQDSGPHGNTGDIVGAAIGMSRPTYERAKLVVDAAEDETLPDDVRAIAIEARDEMDRTGKVLPAHDKVAPMVGKKAAKGGVTRNGTGVRADTSAPYNPVTTRQKQLAGAQKRRMITAIATISGYCHGMKDLDMPMLLSVCSDEERAEWAGQARECSRAIRTFGNSLLQKEG